MARVGLWVCLALLVLVASGSAIGLCSIELPSGSAASGVRIAGAAIGADAGAQRSLEAEVAALAERLRAAPIRFTLVASDGGAELEDTLGGVGIDVDAEATLRRARAPGRRGSPLLRWRELAAVRRQGVDVPLALSFEHARLVARLSALKSARDRTPQPARFPASAQALGADVPGRYLDVERAADAVWAQALEQAARIGAQPEPAARFEIALQEVSVSSRVNRESLRDFHPRHVLSEYDTRFRTQGDQATRAANIAVAASRIDGVILLPGDRMSFNDVVGERSLDNGFHDSWEILDGELVRGVGGGTCQVSSTLNAAALRAGLRVVEAYTHSRPLAYIEKGLDATVAWPFVDLKLENTWPVPVVIQAKVVGNRIDVRLLSESSPGRVTLRSEVKETVPFPRVVEVGRAPRGSYKLRQAGIPGFRIQRTRLIWPRDGELRREVVFKRYRPTPETFLVAPDFDTSELPPLPEGAEGYDPEQQEGDETIPDFPGAERQQDGTAPALEPVPERPSSTSKPSTRQRLLTGT